MNAVILPVRCISSADERTVDALVDEALDLGLVPCSLMRGAFRIAFFSPDHIPAGWAKFGATFKDAPPCAA